MIFVAQYEAKRPRHNDTSVQKIGRHTYFIERIKPKQPANAFAALLFFKIGVYLAEGIKTLFVQSDPVIFDFYFDFIFFAKMCYIDIDYAAVYHAAL